ARPPPGVALARIRTPLLGGERLRLVVCARRDRVLAHRARAAGRRTRARGAVGGISGPRRGPSRCARAAGRGALDAASIARPPGHAAAVAAPRGPAADTPPPAPPRAVDPGQSHLDARQLRDRRRLAAGAVLPGGLHRRLR